MTAEHHGHTKSGTPLTDELIEKLADEAEAGYDVDEILGRRGKRGRPALGSGPSTVESVRLDPELKARLAQRAEDEGVPLSEVIREALRHHLDAAS
jgi:predicted HicB family RNase H-like nuclease